MTPPYGKAEITFPSKEELEKIRRRQKTEGIINSISDMSRALSNLFATSQYAPNGYQGNIMTDTMQKRFDREKAEMDANADKYYNYAMTVGKLKDYVEQQKYQRGRDKISDGYKAAAEKRAQEQADFERSLDPFKYQEQGYKTLKALYDSDKSKTDATYAPLKQEADIVLTKAKTKTEKHRQGALDASARNSIAAAAAHNRSNLLEYTAEDEHGNKKQFANKNAAVAYAKSHHTYVNEGSVDADSNTYDDNGNLISKGSAKQKYGGYAMITDDTMPGTGSKGVMPGVK